MLSVWEDKKKKKKKKKKRNEWCHEGDADKYFGIGNKSSLIVREIWSFQKTPAHVH